MFLGFGAFVLFSGTDKEIDVAAYRKMISRMEDCRIVPPDVTLLDVLKPRHWPDHNGGSLDFAVWWDRYAVGIPGSFEGSCSRNAHRDVNLSSESLRKGDHDFVFCGVVAGRYEPNKNCKRERQSLLQNRSPFTHSERLGDGPLVINCNIVAHCPNVHSFCMK